LKAESRILVTKEFEDCLGNKFTLFVIVRGKKGSEHLELIDGDNNTVIKYLQLSKLMDEIRLFINLNEPYEHKLQKIPHAVRLRLEESFKLLNTLAREVNRLICADTT